MPEIGRMSLHHETHEDDGADEISLTGLTLPAHGPSHEKDGADEIDATGLQGTEGKLEPLAIQPLAGDPQWFILTQTMHNGAYALNTTETGDGTARRIQVTHDAWPGEGGTITITGTAINDSTIVDVIDIAAGATQSTKMFKTVTSIVQEGFNPEGPPYQISVGYGKDWDEVGLAHLPQADGFALCLLDGVQQEGAYITNTSPIEKVSVRVCYAGGFDGFKWLRMIYSKA